ncbi:TRAP transporter small permease [Blastococcus saxobsidens]|nr:TRAP transporter small permease [Blastococcus saxobsidens]
MVLVTYSAVARYLFSSPVTGSQAWVGDYLAPAITFFALSAALRSRRHIGVTFLLTRMGPGVRLLSQTIAAVMIAGVFVAVAYQGMLRTQAAVATGQSHALLGVPLALTYAVVPLGCALLVLRSLLICAQWWTGDRSNIALSPAHEESPEVPSTGIHE